MKCNICGRRFPVRRESVYQVTEQSTLMERLAMGAKVYDVMGCAYCGWQRVLAMRMPKVPDDWEGNNE